MTQLPELPDQRVLIEKPMTDQEREKVIDAQMAKWCVNLITFARISISPAGDKTLIEGWQSRPHYPSEPDFRTAYDSDRRSSLGPT